MAAVRADGPQGDRAYPPRGLWEAAGVLGEGGVLFGNVHFFCRLLYVFLPPKGSFSTEILPVSLVLLRNVGSCMQATF